MAALAQPTEGRASTASARYRAAEAALWARHGIDVIEHQIALDEPRVRIRVVEAGSGPPILFVPGTGGTGPYWAPLIRELGGFRCLMVDRPGWGLSSPFKWQASTYGMNAAKIQRGVLDRLGVNQADVVGASIGNLWTFRLAQYEPARVHRVMMLGGGPVAEFPIPRFIRLLASPIGAVMVRLPTPPRAHQSQLEAIGHGRSVAAGRMDDFIAWRTAFARETPSLRHERAMVQSLIGGSGWRAGVIPTDADVAALGHPVRMLVGSEDPTGSLEVWRRFTGRLRNGELDVLDGAGHMPWWDDAEAVGRSVRTFLA
jgi:pimeloyl-ACP methyl ester carboxylesterase